MARAIGSVSVKKNGQVQYNAFWELKDGTFGHVDKLLGDPQLAERVRNKTAFKKLQRLLYEAKGVQYL